MKKTIALLLVLGGSLGLAVSANALPAANTPVFGLVLEDSSGSSTALNSNQDPSLQAQTQDPNAQTINGDDQADNSDYDTNNDDNTMDNTDADSDGSDADDDNN